MKLAASKIRDLFPDPAVPRGAEDRSMYERFAVPYVFRPHLSLAEAIVAAGFAFMRIAFGSLLFALCGTGMLMAWSQIPGPFWRVAAELPLFILFLCLFASLMLAISALARKRLPRHP